MSVYTDFQKFVNDLEVSSAFKSWCSNGPSDCTAWKAYRTGLLTQTPPPNAPTLSTSFGKTLVDVGVMAVNAGLVAPPPKPPIKAAFTYSISGLTASFTNLSTPGPSGVITASHWDFGDGTTSDVEGPPPHTYSSAGTRTVTLKVTGGGTDGTSTVSASVTVSVAPPPPKGGTPGIGVCQLGSSISDVTSPNIYSVVIASAGVDLPLQESVPGRGLSYFNGTVVSTSFSTGVPYSQASANGWLLKDASGNFLVNPTYGTYAADIGSAGYRSAWISNVLAYLAAHPGIDGIFIDAVLMDPKSAFGTYPAKYPSTASWSAATVGFIAAVYSALHAAGYYVAINANSYKSGDSTWNDGTSMIAWWTSCASHCDALMNEYYDETSDGTAKLRATGGAWYQQWTGWQRLIGTAQGLGKDFFGLMYGTGTGPMVYGKASFLLEWDGGGGAFMFHVGSGAAARTNPTNAVWTTSIGTPSGGKVAVGVGFRRDYSGGTVLVNPSPSVSQAFIVGGVTHTLAPISALIL